MGQSRTETKRSRPGAGLTRIDRTGTAEVIQNSDGRLTISVPLQITRRRGRKLVTLPSRMVNLTTLAPEIVAAILDEPLRPDLTLFDLAVDPPALWEEQRNRIEGMMPRSRIESCR